MKKLLVFALVLAATAVFGLTQLNTNATTKSRDCDKNAIMYCGAYSKTEFANKLKSGNKHYSSKNMKAVYKTYGIDTSLKGAKSGKVYKDGRIVVNGKTVATNAWSVGRHNFGKSTKVTGNGVTTYKRAVSTSFVSGSIDAWVMFNKDGTFKNALLKSCGNPVGGNNKVPKKSAKCDNLSAKKITRTKFEFTGKASVKNGAKVTGYTFDFGDGKKTTVKTSAKSKTVSHTYAKPGTYKVKVTVNTDQGAKTSSNCTTTVKVEQPPKKPVATCDGLDATKKSRTQYEFTAKASAKDGAKITGYTFNFGDGTSKKQTSNKVTHNYAKPGKYTVSVTVHTSVGDKTGTKCKTAVDVPPAPVATCDGLSASVADHKAFTLNAAASAENGAVIKAYLFEVTDKDGKNVFSRTVITANDTAKVAGELKPGTYTAKVTVKTSLGDKTSKNCETQFTITKAPVATCDGLDAKVTDRTNYELTAHASAANGASIKNYTFVITDKNGKTVVNKTTSDSTLTGSLEAGTYTAKVTVHTSLGDRSGSDCATQFTVVPPTKIQVCDLESKEIITIDEKDFDESKHSKNLEDCKEVVEKVEVCDTDTGKIVEVDESDLNDSRYSKDLSDCETPAELPETGAGGISAALGLGSIVTAVTYYVSSRRNLLSSLLGR